MHRNSSSGSSAGNIRDDHARLTLSHNLLTKRNGHLAEAVAKRNRYIATCHLAILILLAVVTLLASATFMYRSRALRAEGRVVTIQHSVNEAIEREVASALAMDGE